MTNTIILPVLAAAVLASVAYAAPAAAPAVKKPAVAAKTAAPAKPAPPPALPVASASQNSATSVVPSALTTADSSAAIPTASAPSATLAVAPLAEPAAPASATATVASAVSPLSITPASAVNPEEEEAPPRLTPFYSFEWAENLGMPSRGNFLFGANLGTTLGGRYVLNPEHAFLAAYELVYDGPGLRAVEGQEFTERSTDHSFSLGHIWGFMPGLKLNSRLTYLGEYRRSGSNEPWGQGLYDFRSIGLTEGVRMPLIPRLTGDFQVSAASVKFPNYTDLIAEFQMGGSTAEKTGGFQDYDRITIKPAVKYGEQGSAWVSWSAQLFEHARVISDSLAYGDVKQRENIYEFGGSWKQVFLGKSRGFSSELSLEPSLSIDLKDSNQNFLMFKSMATLPDFKPDYYSYNAYDFGVPVRWSLADGTMLVFAPQIIKRDYRARPPRDAAGEYMDGKKQWNQVVLLNWGLSWRAYRFARWTIGYTYQMSKSNNKFERYLPYNYFGHVVAASLNLTY
jgi:hypothetical protein